MAGFRPKNANSTSNNAKREFDPNRKYPEPKPGSRPGRVSLIVDLGTQERADFEDAKTGELRPQKPCQQVAVFIDLTNDVVDYGGDIGKQPYRICANKTFQGITKGINFTATPPRDANGNMISGKPWSLHPASPLTKICKATQMFDVIESMEIDKLLNCPLMVQVEVKKTESKDKKDEAGNPVVLTNVNYKGAAEVPLVGVTDAEGNPVIDEDGNQVEKPVYVGPLKLDPLCITFDNAKAEHIKFIRQSLIAKIKLAKDYAGSQMQRAVEEYEATTASQKPQEASVKAAEGVDEVKPKQSPAKAVKKAPEPVVEEFDEEDSPFN